jgi:hypothetical protein
MVNKQIMRPKMDPETKERISDRNIWARGLYTLFFVIAYSVAETVLSLLAIFQFIAALVTGHVNEVLLRFGANLSRFIYQILQFVTFNNDTIPFPFTDWPDVEPGTTSAWVKTASPTESETPTAKPASPVATSVAEEPAGQVDETDPEADDASSDDPATDSSDKPDRD